MKTLPTFIRTGLVAILAITLPKLAAAEKEVRFSEESQAPDEALSLWYRRPAGGWTDALAIGNGRLGGIVFGRVQEERIQLNEDTFWSGQPYDPTNSEALQYLPEVRKMIFNGEYKTAENLIQSKMRGKPPGQAAYQTVGELILNFPGMEQVADYRRDLNLDTAVASVRYTNDGTTFTREVFSTPVDQVLAMRITASRPGKITFSTTLTSPQNVTTAVDGKDAILLQGAGGGKGRNGIPGAVKFAVRLQVLPDGGSISATADTLTVTGANSVVLLLDAGTSFINYKDISGDPLAKIQKHLSAAVPTTWDQLKAAHIKEHQRYFVASLSIPAPRPLRNCPVTNDCSSSRKVRTILLSHRCIFNLDVTF